MTTATAGKILIELEIDDRGVPIAVRRSGASLRELQGTLKQTADSVKKLEDAHTGLGAQLYKTIATLGYLRFAAMDVNDIFFRLPLSIMKSAGELERMQLLMKGLSKELTEVGRSAEGFRDFNYVIGLSKKAPFDIQALSDSFVKLKVAGLDPTKGSMSALVDSVAKFGGTSETLKRASIAIQQMSGKGVISMEELRQQLGEAIPTAMQDMADGMGVSMAKLANIVKTGTLTTGPALDKMFVQMRINNEGAAEAMMKTWGGTLSRLKTEWQLTAAFIAESDFGKAAKEAVGKITEALQTNEFRRFANDAGAALGSTTNSLVSGVEWLIKYRSEIALLAEGWIAYKIVFSGIVPLANAIGNTYDKSATAIKREVSLLRESATAKQALAVQSATSTLQEAQANAAKTAEKLALDIKEIESVRLRNAAILAEQVRMNAAMAAGGGVKLPDSSRFQSKQAGREYQGDLATKGAELAYRERELALAIANSTSALSAKEAAAAKAVTALSSVANVSKTAQFASMAMTAATTAAGAAYSLLGGPIGIAIIAITGLVWWYNRAAAAAEESTARQRRAVAGVSDAGDVAAARIAKTVAEADLKQAKRTAQSDYKMDGMDAGNKKTAKDREADAQAILKGSEKVMAAQAQVTLSEAAFEKSNAKYLAGVVGSRVDGVIDGLKTEGREKIEQINQNTRDIISAKEKATGKTLTAEEVSAIKAQESGKRTQAMMSSLKKQMAATEAAGVFLGKSALGLPAGSEKSGLLAAAEVEMQKYKTMQGDYAELQRQIESKVTSTEKGNGAKGRSPMQVMVDNLIIEKARLDAMLPGLMSSIGKIDSVSVELAKYDATVATHAKDATAKDKDGKNIKTGPSPALVAQGRELTRITAETKVAVDDFKSLNEKIIADGPDFEQAKAFLSNPLGKLDGTKTNQFNETIAKFKENPERMVLLGAVTAEMQKTFLDKLRLGAAQAETIDLAASWKPLIADVQQLGPQYELALLRMANPLETVSESKTAKFDKMLAKLKKTPGDLRDISGNLLVAAADVNNVIEQLERGKKEAATIDLSESYKTLVDDNRKANFDIIQDDRARTRLQMQSENDLAAARTKRHIDNAAKAGVEIRLIDQMETEAAANAILRAEDLRLKTRSPLEKLTDDWKNSLNQMEDAQARWADGFLNTISDVTNKGKIDFGGFTKSVLSDILKMQFKSKLGDPIKSVINAGTDKLTQWMPNLGSNAGAPASSAAQLASSQFASSAAAAFRDTERAARSAGDGLLAMVNDGVGPAAAGLVESVVKQTAEAAASSAMTTATTAATSAITAVTSAVYAFTAALQAGSGSSGAGGLGSKIAGLFGGKDFDMYGGASGATNSSLMSMFGNSVKFANGGIMRSMGAMSLKKYAAGGIANSPQMAIFGEGDMNEAYVPLPDGRRIPVALSGGGAGGQPASVTVNVINQTGNQVAAQQGQTRFDGKQMILDVVLTAASQPGGFRDGMKGAMK